MSLIQVPWTPKLPSIVVLHVLIVGTVDVASSLTRIEGHLGGGRVGRLRIHRSFGGSAGILAVKLGVVTSNVVIV